MADTLLTCTCCCAHILLPEGALLLPCPYCGTSNARPAAHGPSLDMLNHAVRQRLACDFYDAERSYQHVLLYHPDEHEALWGRLLCHYGVEYVEDPHTKKRQPIVHTVQPRPLQPHPDFAAACMFAPPEIRAHYEADAAYIDNAQAAIRMNAEYCPPYDVFLCHKTTLPGSSEKTADYTRAFRLWSYLERQGIRAFFAPECLANIAGADYEAGIYHAIHTAKVMLVLCSEPEWLTSAWVRSEWSRFLPLVDADRQKRLIPLFYNGFRADQMPAEFRFRRLQGLYMEDPEAMGKLMGIVGRSKPQKPETPQITPEPVSAPVAQPAVASVVSAVPPLLQRASLFLEDGDWDRADEYAEKVLDQEPRNARAYVVKLLSRLHLAELAALAQQVELSLETDGNYKKALRFGDAPLQKELKDIAAALTQAKKKHAEEQRKAEEKRKADAKRQAEEAHRAEEKRKVDEARRKEEERKAAEARRRAELESIYAVGKTITLGSMQGKPLQWQVLARKGNQALLLAKKPVAFRPYHKELVGITWEQCDLRRWLNADFATAAFTAEERSRIAWSQVPAEKNPEYTTNPGHATKDSLFLLSYHSAQKYLSTNAYRRCLDDSGEAHWWWLRTPGHLTRSATGVQNTGEMDVDGHAIITNYAVRPALWLNF